eukprot:NODE_1313_length_970_cov_472.446254_g1009_i0.p1 GENE.NODE_1313_length_970_cov_472.446254_g1009_i0~~NODE_1313_length_970_cov_472.446254_g1009_i0.p1  ORF type:complete len:245 (+),score=44.03 NODE_1313_length_970_cov_472.446254_g1009_i0:71-805(+)
MLCKLLFASLLAVVSASILMEVTFDLALQQESETGYTASHTVEEYLRDPNLLWLRYLNPLLSGALGHTPMRTALLEFKDYAGWAQFEGTNLERTHVLYDLFWINWKRLLWESDDTLTVKGVQRTEEKVGGYLYVLRYGVKDGKATDCSRFLRSQLSSFHGELGSNGDFIERRAFRNGLWQNEITNLEWYEFTSLEAMSKAVFESPTFLKTLEDAKDQFFSRYTTAIMVPSSGSQGGKIFQGPSE